MLASDKLLASEYEKIRNENPDKIVHLDIIDRIIDTKLNDNNKDYNKFIIETYQEYLEELEKLPNNVLDKYLKTLKDADLRDNQKVENVDSFLIELLLQSERKHAIDEALDKDKLDETTFLKMHRILLKGANSDLQHYNYRPNNISFVGYFEGEGENKKRIINFLPLDYKEIPKAIDKIIPYFNEEENDTNNLFIKPYKIHGILAALQVFYDGNKRTARILQNIKIYKHTNHMLKYNFKNPTLYVTKQYLIDQKEYRKSIREMVENPNNETINNWFKMNLRETYSAINLGNSNIEKMKTLRK